MEWTRESYKIEEIRDKRDGISTFVSKAVYSDIHGDILKLIRTSPTQLEIPIRTLITL